MLVPVVRLQMRGLAGIRTSASLLRARAVHVAPATRARATGIVQSEPKTAAKMSRPSPSSCGIRASTPAGHCSTPP